MSTVPSLKKEAIHGAFWSSAERVGQQFVQFIVSIILARILAPEDFGIIGMVVIFISLARVLVDSGFGSALIQNQDANHVDESTIFWFNCLAGLIMAGMLFLSAEQIAAFYGKPLLVPITRVLSLNLVFSSLGIVHQSLLSKALNFRARMIAIFASMISGGTVGIIMALLGFGVWSLVVQSIVMSLVQTAGMWMVHSWRPLWVFRMKSFKNLYAFGGRMLASSLLNTVFDNVYMVVIGKAYSAADLGFYHRGKRLTQLTSHTLSQVMSQVGFPVLSRLQTPSARMRRAIEQILQVVMFINLPMMIGMMIAAPNVIFVLLGEKWLPTVPYLQVLCLVGVLYPLHALNVNFLAAIGRSDIFLRLAIIKKSLVVLNILLTWQHGILALLWGQVACSVAGLFINLFYTHRFLNFGPAAQCWAVRQSILATSLMAGLLLWLGQWTVDTGRYFNLLFQVTAGALAYFLFACMFHDPAIKQGKIFLMTWFAVGKENS